MLNIGIVGTGSRGKTFSAGIGNLKCAKGRARIAALCDTNYKRLEAAKKVYEIDVPTYTDYEEFLKQDLDAVIVTTPCDSHAELTIKALEAGKYVLCEKAMAIKPEDLNAMMEAEKKSGKGIQLGLCLRYADFMRDLIPVIKRGEIGEVIMTSLMVTLEGSDHFNRWHRLKELSGGILLQKGTHGLDLVNRIMGGAKPKTVCATGGRNVFKAREECAGRRCLTCPEKTSCREFLDIEKNPKDKALYKDCEDVDGYIWDRCVFDPENDIYDNTMVQIEYENGTRANYALSLFYDSGEGIEHEFIIIGTEGRIDVSRRREEIVIHRRRTNDVIRYKLQGHGEGFDTEMGDFLNMIETGEKPLADSYAGYWCAMEGLAAEKSIEESRLINISEMV